MSQTNAADYGDLAKGRAGQLADISPNNINSFAAEGAIAFGLAVTSGTNGNKEVVVVDADDVPFVGVALLTHTVTVDVGGTPAYAIGDTVNVMRQGAVYVEVTSDVAAEAAAYVDVATGKFTDVSTDNLAVPNGIFVESATSGNIAKLLIK